MTTLELEQKNIIDKLNEIALEMNWGTVDRINNKSKVAIVIEEAIDEIMKLRKSANINT